MPNVHLLKELFEGQDAIYIEKGALRVRVVEIQIDRIEEMVVVDVEEVPTPGLDFVMRHTPEFDAQSARRWRIGTRVGFGSTFTFWRWGAGAHGGWSLYFDPEILREVVRLAEAFPADLHPAQRYRQILKCIYSFPQQPTTTFTI